MACFFSGSMSAISFVRWACSCSRHMLQGVHRSSSLWRCSVAFYSTKYHGQTPVIKCIGLSMGLLLWGGSNMVAGWASGTFGILGLPAPTTPLTTPWLNYLGVALSLASLGLYSFVETNVSGKEGWGCVASMRSSRRGRLRGSAIAPHSRI